MSFTFKDKQKSLKRRFLLILGVVTFLCFLGFGLMVIFWDGIASQLPDYQRKIFGGIIILYSVLRFSRLLKKEENE
jgi:putative flippase GtrA